MLCCWLWFRVSKESSHTGQSLYYCLDHTTGKCKGLDEFSKCVIVQDWKDCLQVAYSGSPADLAGLSSPLLLMNLTFLLVRITSLVLSGTHAVSSLLHCVFSRLQCYNSTPIFSFSEAFNLRSGISLAFPHTMNVASTVVQTGACLWPPGRIERKSVFLPFALSPFWATREEMKHIYLGFPSSLNPSCVHPSALLSNTHVHKPPETMRPCSAVDIQKGPEWMAGIGMHWLSACLPIFQRSWWLY